MSEALLLVAEGYEQIAAGIRKMVAAQKDTPKKEEKTVKKAEKKETPVEDTPKDEAAQKEKTVDRKMVRAFLADSMFLNANSKQAPQIVDRQVQPILDQSEVYSGCYGRVSITFYAYNSNGNKGIAAGLGNVQKLRDGEPLGSRANAKDEFEAVDAEDDFLA